jgi:hypothetical protein
MYLPFSMKAIAGARSSSKAETAFRPPAAWGLFPAATSKRVLIPVALAMLLLSSCQSPDPVAKEKERTLSPDERYLVDCYMRIIEFEKYLHDNPGGAEDERAEIQKSFDARRIRRTLAELEKKPERWLAIYSRINELQLRALQKQPTGQD